jgi:predicted GNAT superfamily acetyltransferase
VSEGKAPTTASALAIRKCESLSEMRAAFALQKEVWQFTDAELVPIRVFVLASKIGGHVIGAFDQEEMVSFALAIPGYRNGHSYLHSHMLAVRTQ